MDNSSSTLSAKRKWLLFQAAADFFFLLNKSYPRTAALELAGNRYDLNAMERMLLSRGLFSQREALGRLKKRVAGPGWQRELLVVDGHNVQITIESCIEDRPLLKANDGALRDLAGQSHRFRLTETSNMAIDMVFKFFVEFPPREVLFLFDEPMSRSGDLAAIYRDRLIRAGISGRARTAPVPEREIPCDECVVASSDRAILDSSSRWVDLACRIIEGFGTPRMTADFSGIILADSANRRLFEDGGPYW
ncbi:MAG: DUF434 domain-containing protein [Syntrophobacteraceae bacterium]|jgi:hypothetical protein